MKKKSESFAPATATYKQSLRISRPNITIGNWWILSDPRRNTVTIAEQKIGHAPDQCVTIPRKQFNKLAAWYFKPQKPVRK